ncbi:MAG TPA: ABC transporter ATP-binding protein [Polyangiales bacterium]|nr:ABC transporter ATP-binding protein [Polyangiales bacterium]
MSANAALLELSGLRTVFDTEAGQVRAVDGVSFSLSRGATLGIVGESGSGKSVMSLSILRLISAPGRISDGQIVLEGRDLLKLSEDQMRELRGKTVAMIFQEPMTSLNPVYTVGRQIGEVLELHEGLKKQQARERSIELLKSVGIPAPERRIDSYPHELSGGMRQRVMIAMAIACRPKLLIADEPTTALDVTIQAQILDLLARLRRELGMGIMLITHDLGVVSEVADEVMVMYAGTVVEHAPKAALFDKPLHPYTKGLLRSVPGGEGDSPKRRLRTIEGMVPDLAQLPPGCRFRQRCPEAIERCAQAEPALLELEPGRRAACFVAAERAGLTS